MKNVATNPTPAQAESRIDWEAIRFFGGMIAGVALISAPCIAWMLQLIEVSK